MSAGLRTSRDHGEARTTPSASETSRTAGAVAEELAAAQGAAQVVLEGELVDREVTSPAGCIAMGLQYLQTNDAAVASLFALPGEATALAYNFLHIHVQVITSHLDSQTRGLPWTS